VFSPIHLDHDAVETAIVGMAIVHRKGEKTVTLPAPPESAPRNACPVERLEVEFLVRRMHRSSSSANPTMIVSMFSTRLKSPTIGIGAAGADRHGLPAPFVRQGGAGLAERGIVERQLLRRGVAIALNDTEQSAGTRARTKAWKASRPSPDSGRRPAGTKPSPSPRGITVLAPSRYRRRRCR